MRFPCVQKNRIFLKNPVFLKNFMPEKIMFQINGELVLYRFPIEKTLISRQKEVFVCSKNRIFLKNPVFPKNLCFRSMANWYHTDSPLKICFVLIPAVFGSGG